MTGETYYMDLTPKQLDISVVIPTFQCAAQLSQAIDSVVAQQYPADKYEIIVVDDGSTDETSQIAHHYEARVRYFYQRNQGVAAARNAGIAAARGGYVAFLDADDYWLPDRLSALSQHLGGEARQIVTTDFFVMVDNTTSNVANYRERGLEWAFDLEPAEQLKVVLEDNFLSYMMVVPRHVFDEVGLFDESLHYGEDWDLWLRCLSAGYPVRLVRQPQAVYRYLRPGSSTTRNDYSKAQDRMRILQRYRKYVSPRRWRMATGVMHHVGLRESLASRAYPSAFAHGARVLLNPTYLRRLLANRWARTQDRNVETDA